MTTRVRFGIHFTRWPAAVLSALDIRLRMRTSSIVMSAKKQRKSTMAAGVCRTCCKAIRLIGSLRTEASLRTNWIYDLRAPWDPDIRLSAERSPDRTQGLACEPQQLLSFSHALAKRARTYRQWQEPQPKMPPDTLRIPNGHWHVSASVRATRSRPTLDEPRRPPLRHASRTGRMPEEIDAISSPLATTSIAALRSVAM